MATQDNLAGSDKEADKREHNSFGIIFIPVLSRQRYFLAMKFIEKVQPKKLVDYGCAEGKFIWHLREKNFAFLEEILGVDVDKPTLKRCQNVAKPHKATHNIDRETPLRIGLYCGSLTQWDPRMEGVEFVSLIEVIEHLEEDVLTQLPSAIFGVLKPKSVFVTTPNSEFNILFKDFSGFRHPDHKFEWNRDEFMKWCETICHNFPYQVEYCGAGEPPLTHKEVGYCSQGAFFTQKQQDDNNNNKICTQTDQSNLELTYKEVICKDFPLKTEESSSPVKQEESSSPVKQEESSSPVKQEESSSPVKQEESSSPVKTEL